MPCLVCLVDGCSREQSTSAQGVVGEKVYADWYALRYRVMLTNTCSVIINSTWQTKKKLAVHRLMTMMQMPPRYAGMIDMLQLWHVQLCYPSHMPGALAVAVSSWQACAIIVTPILLIILVLISRRITCV